MRHQNTDQPLSLSVLDTPDNRPTCVTQYTRQTRTQTSPCHSMLETCQNIDQPVSLSLRDRQNHKLTLVTQCKLHINTDPDMPRSLRGQEEHRITQATKCKSLMLTDQPLALSVRYTRTKTNPYNSVYIN